MIYKWAVYVLCVYLILLFSSLKEKWESPSKFATEFKWSRYVKIFLSKWIWDRISYILEIVSITLLFLGRVVLVAVARFVRWFPSKCVNHLVNKQTTATCVRWPSSKEIQTVDPATESLEDHTNIRIAIEYLYPWYTFEYFQWPTMILG